MKEDSRTVDKYGFFTTPDSDKKPENILQENARCEKWAKMLGDWDRYTISKAKVLKERVRKGIPSCFRGQV